MLRHVAGGVAILLSACVSSVPHELNSSMIRDGIETPQIEAVSQWVIAIHGGSGVKSRAEMTVELQGQYEAVLRRALMAGSDVLAQGGRAPEAVEAAIVVLEDSPLFNAGVGGAVDETGSVRHDAAIMDGSSRDAGAVAGSAIIKNPIRAARRIMETTETVLLDGPGAEAFAEAEGLALVAPESFLTEERLQMQRNVRQRGRKEDKSPALQDAERFGTVGAVALDQYGNLAAGTSTGGRTNKPFGRIGDTPILGAGTYAANQSCAVSATGHGEFFMRWTVARDICARVEFSGQSLPEAARSVVLEELREQGGSGAIIALSPQGEVVFAMNGRGMYRGVSTPQHGLRTAVYFDEAVD